MRYFVIVMVLLSWGCEKSLSTTDKLTICKTICGKRSINDFSTSYDDHFDCRCGDRVECEPVCDGGRP